MIASVDVLHSGMEVVFYGKFQGGLIVTEKWDRWNVEKGEFYEEVAEPDAFFCGMSEGNVLRFGSG